MDLFCLRGGVALNRQSSETELEQKKKDHGKYDCDPDSR
jgi:hypothetical protein